MQVFEMIRDNYPEYSNIEQYPADKTVCIRGTHDEWGILSNFAITPIVVDGITYDCTERLFHIMKFKPEATEGIKEMMEVPSGMRIKMRIKHLYKEHPEWFHDHWPSMVVDAMKFCLVQKYEQSEAFRKELERSKGMFIVEDETSRKKGRDADSWGVVLKGETYVGPNLLGRLLMELRDGFLRIPQRRKTIKESEFAFRKDLVSVEMPDSVCIIDKNAFFDCENLESVKLSENLEIIEAGAFMKCFKLRNVVIPLGVRYIGDDAFGMCHDIHLRIPKEARVSKTVFRESSNCSIEVY